MELPHHLHSPLEVQAFLDHLPEHLFCLMFTLLQCQGVLDVVSVLYASQLWDTCGPHLGGGRGGVDRGVVMGGVYYNGGTSKIKNTMGSAISYTIERWSSSWKRFVFFFGGGGR